jgi:hypothetical protein
MISILGSSPEDIILRGFSIFHAVFYRKSKEIDGRIYAMMMESNPAFQNSNMDFLMNKFNIEDESPPSFMIGLKK